MKTLLRGSIHGVKGADAVLVDGDTIAWVGRGRPPERPDEEVIAEPGELIAPGFIDLQVNGYAGHDAGTGADAIAKISEALPATGVTAFLPTLISSPVEAGAEFIAAVGAAAESTGAGCSALMSRDPSSTRRSEAPTRSKTSPNPRHRRSTSS